jgi:hypothetical protein
MGSREGGHLKRVFFLTVNRNEEISMKKTFVTCLAVVALFAIASSASAITCTIDQRPAATLLIPYFQATFNADGTILDTGANALDTLVTIGNASSAPMLAHVNVFNDRSELVLDFNIALTGFDIQGFSMASILRGNLPQTGYFNSSGVLKDGCQRNSSASVFPDETAGGFLRVRPGSPTSPNDNILATTLYPAGPFATSFLFQVIDSLDATDDTNTCGGGVDNTITNPIHGYVTIDHANYCSLSNPSDPAYYTQDAIGMENNLWGDYIYTSGAGLGTLGFAAVAIEADPISFRGTSRLANQTGAPTDLTPGSETGTDPCNTAGALDCIGKRTFYRRYVTVADTNQCDPNNDFTAPSPPVHDNDFDCGYGDQREPLGLKYAARWFDAAPNVTSFFDVWRASSVPSSVTGGKQDLLGTPIGKCNISEPVVTLVFYDEDENTVTSGVCPSPCSQPTFNFPLETQRSGIAAFSHPSAPAGWVSMSFFNGGGPAFGTLDQAWVTYDFEGASAFLSAGAPAAQLDPNTCTPLLVPNLKTGVAPAVTTPTDFVIPVIFGSGP